MSELTKYQADTLTVSGKTHWTRTNQQVYLAADVEQWIREAADHAKKMSEQHLAEGVYTQARNWEGGYHSLERLLDSLKGQP